MCSLQCLKFANMQQLHQCSDVSTILPNAQYMHYFAYDVRGLQSQTCMLCFYFLFQNGSACDHQANPLSHSQKVIIACPSYTSHDITDPNETHITPQLYPQAAANAYQLVQLQRQWEWCLLPSASCSADRSLQSLLAERTENEQSVEL